MRVIFVQYGLKSTLMFHASINFAGEMGVRTINLGVGLKNTFTNDSITLLRGLKVT